MPFILAACLFLLTTLVAQNPKSAESTYSFDQVIQLEGMIFTKTTFYNERDYGFGPLNYHYEVFELKNPICVKERKETTCQKSYMNVKVMQFVPDDEFEKRNQHLRDDYHGKWVQIKGKLSHGNTVWHQTPVLIEPLEIRMIKD